MARRFILAAAIVFLGSHQTFQLILAEAACICLLVYQIRYSPMKESLFNRLEYLNEVSLLSTTLLMTCFTDYTPNEIQPSLVERETRLNIGWLIIAITSLFMVTYMFLIVYGILRGLIAKLRPILERWCKYQNL